MSNGGPQGARERSRRPRGRRIAVGCAAAIVAVVVAELLVRGWAYHLREDFEQYDYATGAYRLVPGTHASDAVGSVRINRDGFRGPELLAPGPDLLRIVAVGDSCTFGSADEARTWPALLQARLDSRSSAGIRREVVNGAVSGADSDAALRRVRSKVVGLEPDVVVIYVGWNDLMKYGPAAQADTGLASELQRIVDGLWLVRGIRKALYFHARPALFPPEIGPESRTGRFESFSPTAFEGNLRAMIAAVREVGARPVLVTLPTPVREDMGRERIRERRIGFPYFAGGARLGDFVDLIDAYNRAIRRVALELRTPLIDLARSFGALADPAPYFWDAMHPDHAGQALVAALVEQGLERAGLLAAAPAQAPQAPVDE